MCLQQDYNFTVFLHVKQSENYEQCYDDKCLSPTELQREWSVSDWDCLSTWLQDDIKVMHKNPMIQLEFLSLSQSCHLKLQEGTFICILQWQSFYCKCLLVEDSIHLSVAPEVLLLVPIPQQDPVLMIRNSMAYLWKRLHRLEAASKHNFFIVSTMSYSSEWMAVLHSPGCCWVKKEGKEQDKIWYFF